jgi:hypothetical protein
MEPVNASAGISSPATNDIHYDRGSIRFVNLYELLATKKVRYYGFHFPTALGSTVPVLPPSESTQPGMPRRPAAASAINGERVSTSAESAVWSGISHRYGCRIPQAR